MKKRILVLLSFFSCTARTQEPTYKIVGYYPNWYIYGKTGNQEFKPNQIKANLLTHINYAFAKPYTSNENHDVISYQVSLTDPWADTGHNGSGNFGQLRDLKKKNPHLKTLLAIGGWSIWNEGQPKDKFSQLAADSKLRQQFITSALELCIAHDFDGLDIDWEYPTADDTDNFTLLLKELYAATKDSDRLAKLYKKANKEAKSALLLTIAAPAGPTNMQNIALDKIHPYVDWMNVMTYDYYGPWPDQSITNHNAPLYQPNQGDPKFNIQSTIQYYLDQGVPSSKVVLGMPLFGRSYAGVPAQAFYGLFSPFDGPGLATFTEEPGMILYHTIKNNYLPPAPQSANFKRYWDSKAKVPYLYNEKSQDFISYDDEQSFKEKVTFIIQNKLGGAMFWVLAAEDAQWDLINSVNKQLSQTKLTPLKK